MNMQEIALSKISQIQKNKKHIISLECEIFKKKWNSYKQRVEWQFPQAEDCQGNEEILDKKHKNSVRQNE